MSMLREATFGDLPVLIEMMEEFYAESNYSLDHAEADSAFRTLLDQPSFGAIWISHDEENATGYVVLTICFQMEFGGLVGAIDDLYVRPEFRRKGYANSLLQSLFIECHDRSLKALRVEVSPDNDAALILYRTFGLQPRTDLRGHLTVRLNGEF